MVSNGARDIEPPLRLTRRGRAVVFALLALVASIASAVLFTTASRASVPPVTALPAAASAPAPAPASPAAATRATLVIRPGDTLWSIARDIAPGRDRAATVTELRRLNHLSGDVVRPGDVLILPR